MAEMMQHLTALADEIGPRPATTDAERRAAAYVESAFVARGLVPEVQQFDAPRTYSWAYVIYYVLTIVSAVCAGTWLFGGLLIWPAFALSAIVAFFTWSDLDTRGGLTRLMPKGPSQNVIARHVPKARRGERMKKVVIVAHYDTARSSLAFSPGVVGKFPVAFLLMKVCVFAVPVLLMLVALPLPVSSAVEAYLWYVSLVAAAYLLIPMLVLIHSELAMPFVAGAGDNASGVAAMLGILHNLVSEPDSNRFATSQFAATGVRRSAEAAVDAGVVPEGSLLSYTPAGGRDASTELPDDFTWVEPDGQPVARPHRGQAQLLDFETTESSAVRGDAARSGRGSASTGSSSRASEQSSRRLDSDWAGDAAEGLGATGTLGSAGEARHMDPTPERPRKRGGLLSKIGRRKKHDDSAGVGDWLGVGEGFDAREEGKNIGSWDNFGSSGDDEEEGDGFGWKGGCAGDDPIEDDDFSLNEAARIRRRVTETVDRDLVEKEVWFVATGAKEVGTVGMQAFLAEYGDDIRDALVINIDNVGSGQLSWVTAEGMARAYRANARVVSLAKRVSREREILVKPRVHKGLSTDATPALARGFRAMTLMAFNSAGLPVNWHWSTDTSDAIDPDVVERATALATEMIREA